MWARHAEPATRRCIKADPHSVAPPRHRGSGNARPLLLANRYEPHPQGHPNAGGADPGFPSTQVGSRTEERGFERAGGSRAVGSGRVVVGPLCDAECLRSAGDWVSLLGLGSGPEAAEALRGRSQVPCGLPASTTAGSDTATSSSGPWDRPDAA